MGSQEGGRLDPHAPLGLAQLCENVHGRGGVEACARRQVNAYHICLRLLLPVCIELISVLLAFSAVHGGMGKTKVDKSALLCFHITRCFRIKTSWMTRSLKIFISQPPERSVRGRKLDHQVQGILMPSISIISCRDMYAKTWLKASHADSRKACPLKGPNRQRHHVYRILGPV